MAASFTKYTQFTFFFHDEEHGEVVATESVIVKCPGPESDQEERIAAKLATEVAVKFENQRRRNSGIEGEFFIKAGRPTVNFADPGFGYESADAQIGAQYAWRVDSADATRRRT